MISTYLFNILRLEINAKLPQKEKVGPLFGYPGLGFKVLRLHRHFYPRSALRLVLNLFVVIGALCVLGISWALRLI